MPRDIVGKPAAERRPDDGRHHDRDAEQREALPALLRRKGIGKNRLRHRYHAAAAEALQNAEQQQRLQIPRKSAQHRAAVNSARQIRKKRLRPSSRARKLLDVRRTALETR